MWQTKKTGLDFGHAPYDFKLNSIEHKKDGSRSSLFSLRYRGVTLPVTNAVIAMELTHSARYFFPVQTGLKINSEVGVSGRPLVTS